MADIREDIFGRIGENDPCDQEEKNEASIRRQKKKIKKLKEKKKRAKKKEKAHKKTIKQQAHQIQCLETERRQEAERRHEAEVMLSYIRGRFDGMQQQPGQEIKGRLQLHE